MSRSIKSADSSQSQDKKISKKWLVIPGLIAGGVILADPFIQMNPASIYTTGTLLEPQHIARNAFQLRSRPDNSAAAVTTKPVPSGTCLWLKGDHNVMWSRVAVLTTNGMVDGYVNLQSGNPFGHRRGGRCNDQPIDIQIINPIESPQSSQRQTRRGVNAGTVSAQHTDHQLCVTKRDGLPLHSGSSTGPVIDTLPFNTAVIPTTGRDPKTTWREIRTDFNGGRTVGYVRGNYLEPCTP